MMTFLGQIENAAGINCSGCSHKTAIDDSVKDGGPHFTQCMIGICPLATHSYQNLRLLHKILTTATIAAINLGRRISTLS